MLRVGCLEYQSVWLLLSLVGRSRGDFVCVHRVMTSQIPIASIETVSAPIGREVESHETEGREPRSAKLPVKVEGGTPAASQSRVCLAQEDFIALNYSYVHCIFTRAAQYWCFAEF